MFINQLVKKINSNDMKLIQPYLPTMVSCWLKDFDLKLEGEITIKTLLFKMVTTSLSMEWLQVIASV